jgi:hypothetical protein
LYELSLKVIESYESQKNRNKKLLFNRAENYVESRFQKELSNSLKTLSGANSFPKDSSGLVYCDDKFYDIDKCTAVCNLLKSSLFKDLFYAAGERKISGNSDIIDDMLGERTAVELLLMKEKIHKQAEQICGFPLHEAGSIVSWLSPPNSLTNDTTAGEVVGTNGYAYWNAHCDKANNYEYDVTTLLYLNSDFKGGEFVILEDSEDLIIEPKAGRFLLFHSSLENIHKVQPVLEGERFLFSVWFSKQPLGKFQRRGS